LWTGKLCDATILEKMVSENKFPEEQRFLELLKEECKMEKVGFYDLHEISSFLKVNPPKMEIALKKLHAVRSSFSEHGIKCDKELKEVVKFVKENRS
jgi:tRNA G26 N,N-dimethylase Trm1